MLRRFPGKTLEELDAIDVGRLLRALKALEIERVEDLRIDILQGKAEAKKGEWRQIMRHDRWADEVE